MTPASAIANRAAFKNGLHRKATICGQHMQGRRLPPKEILSQFSDWRDKQRYDWETDREMEIPIGKDLVSSSAMQWDDDVLPSFVLADHRL
jgi:hypothetical protein